jgi:hypothetical protein
MLSLAGCVYSEGDRAGQVVKFSKKGTICKSWEGQMLLGNQQDTSSNVFDFSVTDAQIAGKLHAALMEGKRVVVHYEEYRFGNPCKRDTPYVVTSVS